MLSLLPEFVLSFPPLGEQCGGEPQRSGRPNPAGDGEGRGAAQRLSKQRGLLHPSKGGQRLLQRGRQPVGGHVLYFRRLQLCGISQV